MALKLRVWHIPQVPMEAFRVDVQTLVEAKIVLDALAKYDLFQYENKVKGDYTNAAGLEFNHPQYNEWLDFHPYEVVELENLIDRLYPNMSDHENFLDRLTLEQVRHLEKELMSKIEVVI